MRPSSSPRCPRSSGISTNRSPIPALVPLFFIAREARKHVKVVLSGEGADELFGGYTIYREPLSLKAFDYLPRAGAPFAGQGVAAAARGDAREEPAAPRIADAARSATTATPAASPTPSCARCCPGSVRTGRTPMSPRRCTRHRTAGIRWPRMQHVDLFTWLRGDILVKADKMTMANSLELRVPFLDPEVFAVASTAAVRPEDHPHHHQVRAAPGAGTDRARACAQPAQAAASRCRSGTGCKAGELLDWAHATVAASQAGRPRRPRHAVRTMLDEHRGRCRRSQPPAVDGADLHAVARHLRRAQRDTADQRADLPRSALRPARPRSARADSRHRPRRRRRRSVA